MALGSYAPLGRVNRRYLCSRVAKVLFCSGEVRRYLSCASTLKKRQDMCSGSRWVHTSSYFCVVASLDLSPRSGPPSSLSYLYPIPNAKCTLMSSYYCTAIITQLPKLSSGITCRYNIHTCTPIHTSSLASLARHAEPKANTNPLFRNVSRARIQPRSAPNPAETKRGRSPLKATHGCCCCCRVVVFIETRKQSDSYPPSRNLYASEAELE